ncbi:regulator of G-protein signaling 9-binding protein C [Xenopus laevis]|uniref:Regulator of G-protein signaling 9-binding protein C n=1 Tax=Xenopus laevis TaxID=8355 RepID=R9BPC_XENLA|nr:regulator of G-protein signaling 9-binding protein C [Xenopus laevis]Q6GLU0.1 RecName: Full=Regulator of G-protein signaling 9-binding protein C; AltName: Full=RGS9-anchoring protein C [Xenopus laevis]AAH74363.1 MGC84255 protein [Xenopus laevis]
MPLQNVKVADEGTVNFQKVKEECITAVESLHKVVACYRHLVLTIGGSSDSIHLRDELRRTRERAQELAVCNRNKLTTALRDKKLSKKDCEELERLWVEFSSCLELFHNDMCKVYELATALPHSSTNQPAIQTGSTGNTSAIASRALNVQNINYSDSPANKASLEYQEIEEEILKVDNMITDMEMKVNVLRWTVEANTRMNDELKSTHDSSSVVLLSEEESNSKGCCSDGQLIVSLLLCGTALVAITLYSIL